MQGLLLAGDLYIDPLDENKASTGYLDKVNCSQLTVTPQGENKSIPSTELDSYGQALDTVNVGQPTQIEIILNRYDAEVLNLALAGTRTDKSAAGDSVTSEVVVGYHDRSFVLAHNDVSSVVVKDETDVTTYVLGTDYEITSARLGMIKVLSTGSIGDGDTLHVSYDYAAETGYEIEGGTDNEKRIALYLDGQNLVNGDYVTFLVDVASIMNSSGMDLKSADHIPVTFSGIIEGSYKLRMK